MSYFNSQKEEIASLKKFLANQQKNIKHLNTISELFEKYPDIVKGKDV